MVWGLPFSEVWVIDTEFIAQPGERQYPVCLAAQELGSGRVVQLWRDQLLRRRRPPFPTGRGALYVAFNASAEIETMLQLGWKVPECWLDLYVENRCERNGRPNPYGYSLLGALAAHGLASMTKEEKQEARGLVMRGGPWSGVERLDILGYCLSDATALAPLLERMLPRILHDPRGLGRALLRGRFMIAVARMHAFGIPIDVEWLDRLRSNWADIRLDLISSVDSQYHVYEKGTFKAGRFAEYVEAHGIPWPRTEKGQLSLTDDTFKDQARLYPQLESLRQLRRHLSELRLEGIEVGSDGRNRCSLFPFGARTGRNTPSATKYAFGPSTWLRHLIKPDPGWALLYCDWSAQEIAIAAALSGDGALLDAIATGDPYMAFAIRAGLAPPEATKVTHPRIREVAKVTLLASNYGQGPRSLAARTGVDLSYAREILYRLGTTYPTFTEWSRKAVDHANLGGWTASVFGWPMEVDENTRPTSLRNFPCQANGAEMLRLACIFATEAGVNVTGPIHDALLVESAIGELEATIATTRQAMTTAARLVLGGLDVSVDVKATAWPERYSDPRGTDMWNRVTSLIEARSA